jgi:hypothetical protein
MRSASYGKPYLASQAILFSRATGHEPVAHSFKRIGRMAIGAEASDDPAIADGKLVNANGSASAIAPMVVKKHASDFPHILNY